ncbi:MAG: cyclic-di-AMP receptor [Anaerolineae bacterium]|nr:cyclic-di-AMP receptor [Anaerolineae bacterium]
MKMIMAVVSRDETERVLDALVNAGFTATFSESRGGMLRQAQSMLFIAVEKAELDRALGIIAETCHSRVAVESSEAEQFPSFLRPKPVTAELGSAVVFVWDIDRFETF